MEPQNYQGWMDMLDNLEPLDVKTPHLPEAQVFRHNNKYILKFNMPTGLWISVGYFLDKDDPEFSIDYQYQIVIKLDELIFIPHNEIGPALLTPFREEFYISGHIENNEKILKNRFKFKIKNI